MSPSTTPAADPSLDSMSPGQRSKSAFGSKANEVELSPGTIELAGLTKGKPQDAWHDHA